MRRSWAAVSLLALALGLFAQEEADFQNWMKTTGATVGSFAQEPGGEEW